MTRMIRDDVLIQKIIEKQMELGIVHRDGDSYNLGRIEGLENAIKIVQSLINNDI